jgi:hypothetical protein
MRDKKAADASHTHSMVTFNTYEQRVGPGVLQVTTAPSNRQNAVDSGLISARQWWTRDIVACYHNINIEDELSFENMG